MKKGFILSVLVGFSIIFMTGCFKKDYTTLVIGVAQSPHYEIVDYIKPKLEEQGYKVEIQIFNDYELPNKLLEKNQINVNFFQTSQFLDDFNRDYKTDLVSIANVHYEPMGLYAGKTTKIEELKDGSTITIPDDTANRARALRLLEKIGLIKLNTGVSNVDTSHISENSKNIVLIEKKADTITGDIDNTDMSIINGNYSMKNGIKERLVKKEEFDGVKMKEYSNIVVVKKEDVDKKSIKTLMGLFDGDGLKEFITRKFKGQFIPVM